MTFSNKQKFLFPATCLALFLIPGFAVANNECMPVGVDPSLNGSLADSYECDATSYGDGVTYDADGNLTVDFTVANGITEVEAGGIDLSATGGDSIFFDSQTTTTEIESRAVTGPLLSVTTANGDIDIDTEEMDADGQTPGGVTHAIYAESTGGGSIDINTTGTVDAQGSNPAGSIGIEAITGSGSLTITASGTVAGNDAAIAATTGTGLLTININGSGGIGDIRANAGGDAVINIARNLGFGAGLDLTVAGETTLNNDGTINGALDFSGLSGGYTFNNNTGAVWDVGFNSISSLGAGDLNNAGTIDIPRASVILAPGTIFTGTGTGVLAMTGVVLDGDGQSDCSTVADTELQPTKAAAGCLDLTGGATAGQTAVLIDLTGNNPDPFREVIDTPLSTGVLLVDVSGGTSATDHFVLDPGSENYVADSVYGGVVQTGGLFDYALLYNPNTQQHILSSVPQHEALEYAALIHESLSIWHTTSDTIAGRQADLRHGGQRGGWLRVFADQTERDFKPSVTTHGNTFNYDRRYSLYTGGVIAGYDLTADNSHVLGVHLGFMTTKLEHNDSKTVDETRLPSSVTFGAYGGWWDDSGLTLDGTLNVNLLDIEHDVRDGLEDTRSNVLSVGIRAEAGWRVPLSERFYVQPLVTASYVTADIENLEMRDYDARFEDSNSTRAALGVRLGGDTALNGDKVGKLAYWLTARAWEEYADDNNVQFLTDGAPLVIEDDLSGTFEEVSLGLEATNPEGNLSAYFSTGATFGDDADNYNVSIGARLNW